MRGSIIHELISLLIDGKDYKPRLAEFIKQNEDLFEEEKEEYGLLPESLQAIMSGYVKRYYGKEAKPDDVVFKPLTLPKENPHDIELNKTFPVAKSEYEFTIALEEITGIDVFFEFHIDVLWADQGKALWLVEHKTHKDLPTGEDEFHNLQTALYIGLLRRFLLDNPEYKGLGLKTPSGILWNYIRTKAPSHAEVLKAGGLSKNKAVSTTADIYLEDLKKLNLDPKDYAEFIEYLKGNDVKFYRRVYQPVSLAMTSILVDESISIIKEILAFPGDIFPHNLNKNCSYCDFCRLCDAEVRGYDTDLLYKDY